MAEETPKSPDREPEGRDIDKTIGFNSQETETSLPDFNSATCELTDSSADIPSNLSFEIGATSNHFSDSQLAVPIDATLDSATLLSNSRIDQTIDSRYLNESNSGSSSESETPHLAGRRDGSIDRREITESMLSVPARQLYGMEADAEPNIEGISADYEIIKILGEGGMGTVYLARQAALDRLVALKVVKQLNKDRAEGLESTRKLERAAKNRRDQFLAEALVTGDLDHPNIVPIHDLAVAGEGTLFYVMKKVDGTPWSKVIAQKSRDENLEILLKVCDAIAFAHSRGIVHRDIKPENVMLGEFGVVLLMDWGLAVPKESFAKKGTIYQTSSMGGSPAYMAPEMALGPIDAIGPPSDIYLLGATLFEIIVGRPPHYGKQVLDCIQSVAKNIFIEVPQSKCGELLDIAYKAMETKPSDRFATVADFQDAIRQYRAHTESIMLAARAEEDLALANSTQEYNSYARSVFGFEEAYKLWDGNTRALKGLNSARMEYAEAAYTKEDFDLGLSLLDENEPEHVAVISKLREKKLERESRIARLIWLKRIAIGLVMFIFVGGGAALYQIKKDRDRALAQEIRANAAADEAEEQRVLAEENRLQAENNAKTAIENANEAEIQRSKAEELKDIADMKAQEATRERKNAEYEAYIAQIGLAKARIEQNEFDDARRILIELRSKLGNDATQSWEWKWLWNQSHQSLRTEPLDSAARSLSLDPQKNCVVITLLDGSVQLFQMDTESGLVLRGGRKLPRIANATAASLTPDNRRVAIGDQTGLIQIWDLETESKIGQLLGHSDDITSLVFVDSDLLLSGSRDRSIRLWELQTKTELASCWHIAPVVDLSCNLDPSQLLIAAAVADDRSGRVVVWELGESSDRYQFVRLSDFLGHRKPVSAVAISPTGQLVASGDLSGQILLWAPDEVGIVNYADAITNAIKGLESDKNSHLSEPITSYRTLRDDTVVRPLRLVSTASESGTSAHRDVIKVLGFNSQGTELLSASADFTMKVWEVQSGKLSKTLRGHGGWVQGAAFSGNADQGVVSVSNDQTVRSWQLASLQDTRPYPDQNTEPYEQAAHRDEIWSARFDRSGKRIITASRDHTAKVMEIDSTTLRFAPVASLTEEKQLTLEEGSSFVAISMEVDSVHRRLFIGSADSVVHVWNLDAGTEASRVSGTGLNTVLAVSPDGNLLLTGSSSTDASAIIWNVDPTSGNSSQWLHKLRGHQAAVTAMAFSRDSRFVFTADRNGVGILWDAQTGKPIGEKFLQHLGTRINDVAFHPNGQDILLAGDNQLVSWIRISDRTLRNVFGHDGFVAKLSVSPNGDKLATVSEYTSGKTLNSSLQVWDFASGQSTVLQQTQLTSGENRNLQAEDDARSSQGRILSVSFGDDGQVIASRSDDQSGRVTLWKPELGNDYLVRLTVKIPSVLPECTVADLADPNHLLTLNGDAALLWDLETMKHLQSFRAHAGITEAGFSSDGEYAITASKSIRIWNVNASKSEHKIEHPHAGLVNSVQFSPLANDYRFVSGGDDGQVILWQWDPDSLQSRVLQRLASETSEPIAIHRVRFSPDGQRVLAVDQSGTARLWSIDGSQQSWEFRDQETPSAFLCGAFSSDGKWIAVGCDDRIARIFSVQPDAGITLSPKVILQGHADRIEDIHFLGEDENSLRVITGSRDKSARIWDPRVRSGILQGREILALQRHTLGVTAVDATADGALVMTAGRDGKVILWPASVDQIKETP